MKRATVPYPAELHVLLGVAAPGRGPGSVTPGEYRAECLLRTPAFVTELRPFWAVTAQPLPEAATALADRWGLPGLFPLERPEVGAPIVYDSAFSRAWWETMMRTPRRLRRWYDQETRDRISRSEFGLSWASAEKLPFPDLIRRRFLRLSAAEKAKFRQQGGAGASRRPGYSCRSGPTRSWRTSTASRPSCARRRMRSTGRTGPRRAGEDRSTSTMGSRLSVDVLMPLMRDWITSNS